MLSKIETKHCKDILKLLDSDSVYSLKDTITKGMLAATGRNEAVDIILEYSNSVLELLSRKKLTKETMVKYLFREGVKVDVSGSKEQIIHTVLQHITGNGNRTKSSINPSNSTENPSIQSLSSDLYRHQVANNVAVTDQQIASQFIEWFYPMLNSLSGCCESNSSWSEMHFWSDCTLRCKLPRDDNNNDFDFETYEGAALSQRRLASFVTDCQYIFNVNNTPNGYRGKISEHGLAKVGACGTVHHLASNGNPKMFAVFEQVFGLMRDPREENRWKIKFTDLSVRLSGEHTNLPALSAATETAVYQS